MQPSGDGRRGDRRGGDMKKDRQVTVKMTERLYEMIRAEAEREQRTISSLLFLRLSALYAPVHSAEEGQSRC